MSADTFDNSQIEFLFENFSDLQGRTLRYQFAGLAEEAETLSLSCDDAWNFYTEIQQGLRCAWCGQLGELDGSQPHCEDCHERTCVA